MEIVKSTVSLRPFIACRKKKATAARPATSKVAPSAGGLKDVTISIATPSDSVAGVNAALRSPSRAAKRTAGRNIVDGLFEVSVADATDTDTIDMSASPADTVKKRRRTASWKRAANGLTIVTVDDNLEETEKTPPRKKVARKFNPIVVANNGDHQLGPVDGSVEKQVESWKNGITEGQDFRSVAEFRDVLQKYAIAHRFGYKLRKNDTNRANAVCAVEGCPWRIHASWVPSASVFRVKMLHEPHTCGGESWKIATPAKNWLVNVIKDRLRDSPHHKPKEIATGLLRDFGLELNYAQVWRGIEDARQQLQGSYKDAYNQLPWYCEKIEKTNPGSFTKLVIGDDKRFQRLFLSFNAMIRGFQSNLKGPFFGEGRASLPGCFLAAAKAVRPGGFRMYTEQIKRVSSSAYDWIMQNEPEYWANAFFKGEHFNHITLNIAEAYANWIEEARDLPIIPKVEVIRCKIMELMELRRTESSNWTMKLTPSKQEKLQEECVKARGLKVLFSSDTLFEVHDSSINVVDIVKQHCSCAMWKPTGLPCHHAVAVFNCTGRSVYDYCSKYYTAESFRLAFAESINPASTIAHPCGNEEDSEEDEDQIMPPSISRPVAAQQPKKIRRNKSQGIIRRSVCCTRCKGVGHNKVSCKAKLLGLRCKLNLIIPLCYGGK
ncbi:hypothetical protein GOBAR_AA13240 [Gossypium barbadense]|uniref:SWIM-type domain-containing protein n=1 Tax=Gossypium barbadense TaxID=3634 RepID=A0A2P5XVP7_GOSBA|nr:hypothetical protein GOBAR_AA13240 [Gossypium barbadense]